jgi:hypothetical protein
MAIKSIHINTDGSVRAILDGRKSCTRRIMKPQLTAHYGTQYAKPPYQLGDILYVRETWEHFDCCSCEGDEHGNCPKEPQKSVIDKRGYGCYMYRATDEISGDAKWHPPRYMPKEAARIWLKVTDVRVERLQENAGKCCKRGNKLTMIKKAKRRNREKSLQEMLFMMFRSAARDRYKLG